MQDSKELNQEEDQNIPSSKEEILNVFNDLKFSFSTPQQQFDVDNEENEFEKDDNDYPSGENDHQESYEKYNGYNGWSDEAIDEAFDGDPEATWNVD